MEKKKKKSVRTSNRKRSPPPSHDDLAAPLPRLLAFFCRFRRSLRKSRKS